MLAILAMLAWTPTVQATTSTTDLEYGLLAKINDARTDQGLRPLRLTARIWSVAGTRAARMASTNVLSHTVAGSISSELHAKGIPWYAYGEAIGYTRAKRGTTAMNELFSLWKASPEHWKLMMSSNYNYIGIGLAYRSSNNKTFGSLIFTESPDSTDARVYMNGANVSGGTGTWSWWGTDPVLQTHTAGLRSFDVQLRADDGSWRTVATNTTATSRSWGSLTSGHAYSIRVRARDRSGNVGSWSLVTVRMP
jgi:Cysteine-rich secretory protein family